MGKYSDNIQKRLRDPRTTKTEKTSARKAEEEFHQNRRMFCLMWKLNASELELHVAEPGNRGYHRSWMCELAGRSLDDFEFNRCPRGYYLKPNLVWYQGPFDPVSPVLITQWIADVAKAVDLPSDTNVWNGARLSEDSDVLIGRRSLGDVANFLYNDMA